jgi:hypothetical protein
MWRPILSEDRPPVERYYDDAEVSGSGDVAPGRLDWNSTPELSHWPFALRPSAANNDCCS